MLLRAQAAENPTSICSAKPSTRTHTLLSVPCLLTDRGISPTAARQGSPAGPHCTEPAGGELRPNITAAFTSAQILLQSIIMQLPTGTSMICSCSTYTLRASLLLLRTELPEHLLILLKLAAALDSASAPSALRDRKTASSAHPPIFERGWGRKSCRRQLKAKRVRSFHQLTRWLSRRCRKATCRHQKLPIST